MSEPDAIRLVLIVDGRVRRGMLVPCPNCACENCHRLSTSALVSARGKVTLICAQCVVTCGEPRPPVTADGREWRTLAEARAALARRDPGARWSLLTEAETYERAKAKWDRATRQHGFKHGTRAKSRAHLATWDPYWQAPKSDKEKR